MRSSLRTMTVNADRRSVLKALGSAALLGGVAAAGARLPGGERPSGRLRKRGFPPLSNPAGEYTEADVRSDGRYGVVGSYFGRGGSFLVDLADPTNPTEVHRVPSGPATRNADVAFDPRDGLYYRTQEPNTANGRGGVEVIDYGYGVGSPGNPEIVARIDVGHTHNVAAFPDPEVPIGYTLSPNAAVQNDLLAERLDWTGHNFDVIPRASTTLLVSADYHEGAVLYDVGDPTDPIPVNRYPTDDRAGDDGAGNGSPEDGSVPGRVPARGFPGSTRRWRGGWPTTRLVASPSRSIWLPGSTRSRRRPGTGTETERGERSGRHVSSRFSSIHPICVGGSVELRNCLPNNRYGRD
jgi:hypothetical protein